MPGCTSHDQMHGMHAWGSPSQIASCDESNIDYTKHSHTTLQSDHA